MAYANLFFDLDGTLSDPAEGAVAALRQALVRMGLPELPEAALFSFIGPPLAESFRDLCGLDPEGCRRAILLYREYYEDRGLFENRVYPGIPEVLGELKAQGRRLTLASSKPEPYVVRILDRLGLAAYFDAVAGSDLAETRVEKAAVLAYARDLSPGPVEDCLMVGDRKYDMEGARANGMASLAVGYGYGSPEELRAAGPDHVCATVADLGAFFRARSL